MTHDDIVQPWLDVLEELMSIERDIATIETTCGVSADSVYAREWAHAARGHVLHQLRALVDGGVTVQHVH